MSTKSLSPVSRATLHVAACLVGLSVVIGGCGGQPSASGGLQISDVWARTSPTMATAGAVYMRIANSGTAEDGLVAARVDQSVAASVEIHETVASGSNMGSAPMMEMRPVDRITIPAGSSVALAPGGYHIMLINLTGPLQTGGQIQLTLVFEHAGTIVVTADVRETTP
ncbi:MAG: copper chaperone PCu(A)C [Chloroflexota bacterium]